MSVSKHSFFCPVAKREVTYQTEMGFPRESLPPVTNFKDCDGLSSCGVRQGHADGSSYNWSVCPIHSSMMKG